MGAVVSQMVWIWLGVVDDDDEVVTFELGDGLDFGDVGGVEF